ncbi:methionyl-tRNA formyltransferase [Ereboglobus sp. PH5-5]|uniref:methionyl-tRNA formyltransferase n=1 Tax=Ereboglobus sp. PH5-5 TaxID=2940529 RepID=UPI002406701D|nr:methionyl-tRNA formyltransferase [Ereboglobus sp. PH5-5]MDF9833021.1 methionyl-tRNA formyltransferase [Ereboglobus sp. PH5-5]
MLRIVFMGSDPIALPLLNWIAGADGAQHARIVAVYTQPDRPSGRGMKIRPNAIKTWALEHGIPVHQPEKLTGETRAELASLAPDLSLVMAYGHILRDDFINTPRLGTLNLHTSLLPKYRGASPIQTAIACGERETGVSLMRIVRKLDAGPVADVERVRIENLDTALDVEQKLAAACVPLIARALPRLATGELQFTEQNETDATFCRRLDKADGALDFNVPAAVLAARINGLYPWPACSVEINGTHPIKFGQADSVEWTIPTWMRILSGYKGKVSCVSFGNTLMWAAGGLAGTADPLPPGTILPSDTSIIHIATADGILRIHRLQRPYGKMVPAADYQIKCSISPGTLLSSQPMTKLLS